MKGLVEKYLFEQFNDLHTKCKMTIDEIDGSAAPWLGNADGPSFKAAKEAIEVCIHDMAPFCTLRTKSYHCHRPFIINLPTSRVKEALSMWLLLFLRCSVEKMLSYSRWGGVMMAHSMSFCSFYGCLGVLMS